MVKSGYEYSNIVFYHGKKGNSMGEGGFCGGDGAAEAAGERRAADCRPYDMAGGLSRPCRGRCPHRPAVYGGGLYVDARRALAPSDEGAAEAIARLGERNTESFRVLSLPPSRLTPCHLLPPLCRLRRHLSPLGRVLPSSEGGKGAARRLSPPQLPLASSQKSQYTALC